MILKQFIIFHIGKALCNFQMHMIPDILYSLTLFLVCFALFASVYNVGDLGSILGLGRYPGEGNSNPLQYYCLENPMDRGAWKATVHGVAKSRTQLNNFTSLHFTIP